jgi:hypothetical protein
LLQTDEPADLPRLRKGPDGSYLLRVEPGESDIAVFEQLTADGRAALAEHRNTMAASLLTQALGLWRGTVLQGLPLPDVLRPQN